MNTSRDTIIDCMLSLQKEHPEVHYTVYHHLQENGKDNPFDLCITSYPINQGNLKQIILFQPKILLAIPPNHPLYHYTGEFTPEILRGQSYILTRSTNDIGKRVRLYFNRLGITPNIVLSCNEPHYLKRYLEEDSRIAFVTESYMYYLPTTIRFVSINSDDLHQTIRMYWHTDRYISKTVQILRTLIINHYKSMSTASLEC